MAHDILSYKRITTAYYRVSGNHEPVKCFDLVDHYTNLKVNCLQIVKVT